MTPGYAPRFRLRAFGSLEQSARETLLRLLLEALVAVNVAYLRVHPATPRLMDGSVRYEPDDPGREEWKDIAETLSRGAGDCKDLVAWRLAELRIGGEHAAVARVEFHEAGDGRVLQHMTVRRASGLIEDPSRALGMLAVR